MSNSISQIAADFVKANSNYLNVLQALQSISSSSNKTVIVKITNTDGSVSDYELPSLKYLLDEIKRVSNNIDNLTGNGTTLGASVTLGDGTNVNLYSYQVPSIPEPVVMDADIASFKPVSQDLLDTLTDPKLVVDIDLTSSLDISDNMVMVNRLSIHPQTDDQIALLNSNLIGIQQPYSAIINTLINAGIEYKETLLDIKVNNRAANFEGKFSVIDFESKPINILSDNVGTSVTKIVYKLDTLKYKDMINNSELYLKSGDIIYLVPRSGTKIVADYKVTYVNVETNEICIDINNGYGSPRRGANVFGISPKTKFKGIISVPVKPYEYTGIFIKKVNKATGIHSSDWGSTKIFNSNNLEYEGENIVDYYSNNVNDIRRSLESLIQQGIKPISTDLAPKVPVLDISDLRVERINNHIDGVSSSDEIDRMVSNVSSLRSEISSIDSQIRDNNVALRNNTTLLGSRNSDDIQNNIKSLVSSKKDKISSLKSATDELISKARVTESVSPKYRIRGFWDIPNNTINNGEIINIIGFEYRYRYLRTDETANETSKFKITKDGKRQSATFSNWTVTSNPLKSRTLDVDTNTYVWEDEDLLSENININQLDIPISPNEKVEIQVRSISELGYPGSPLKSDWSDAVIIEFPEQLRSNANINTVIADQSKLSEILDALSSQGVLDHIADSTLYDTEYYSHGAGSISTSFKTQENKPRDVNSVLVELNNKITQLESLLSSSGSEMRIRIMDGNNNVIATVNNSDTIEIFAGYYQEQVSELSIPKGEIITKNYYVVIDNLSESDLELLSYVPGAPNDKVPSSDGYEGYIRDIYEYFNYRKYWEVPIGFNSDINSDQFISHHSSNEYPYQQSNGYQSSQNKSQLIYMRSRDLALNELLYRYPASVSDQVLSIVNSGDATGYVWNLTETDANGVNGSGKLSQFCVHVDHPYLKLGSGFMNNFSNMFNQNYVPLTNLDDEGVLYPAFYHSAFFNLKPTDQYGVSQLGYYQYQKVQAGQVATFSNFPRKLGFIKEDKYLIGSNTVGSYLFVSTANNRSLYTGTNIYNKGIVIKNGDSYAIKVPLIFQYRMTDYNGVSNTGIGNLGGYGAGRMRNLTYSKQMGFDILNKNGNDLFSFDIKFTAKYKPNDLTSIDG